MDRRSSLGIITKASFLVGILPENILLNALKSDKKGEPTDFAILFESLARNILGDHYIEFRKENNLGAFLQCYIENCLSTHEKKSFEEGSSNLQKYCQDNYSSNFQKLKISKMRIVLDHAFSNPKSQIFKNSYKWIYEIRRLILFAFFRSEYGAKKVLRYDPIPGNYVGEVKLEPEDKSWAT